MSSTVSPGSTTTPLSSLYLRISTLGDERGSSQFPWVLEGGELGVGNSILLMIVGSSESESVIKSARDNTWEKMRLTIVKQHDIAVISCVFVVFVV